MTRLSIYQHGHLSAQILETDNFEKVKKLVRKGINNQDFLEDCKTMELVEEEKLENGISFHVLADKENKVTITIQHE